MAPLSGATTVGPRRPSQPSRREAMTLVDHLRYPSRPRSSQNRRLRMGPTLSRAASVGTARASAIQDSLSPDGFGLARWYARGVHAPALRPRQLLSVLIAGVLTEQQQRVIEYLREENPALREQLGTRRLRLNDDQRRRLAAKGKKLGRKLLGEVCMITTPDTILRWHRSLIARKYDGSPTRRSGRPRVMQRVRELTVRTAAENPIEGYRRSRGSLLVLGHRESPDDGLAMPGAAARPRAMRCTARRPASAQHLRTCRISLVDADDIAPLLDRSLLIVRVKAPSIEWATHSTRRGRRSIPRHTSRTPISSTRSTGPISLAVSAGVEDDLRARAGRLASRSRRLAPPMRPGDVPAVVRRGALPGRQRRRRHVHQRRLSNRVDGVPTSFASAE